MSNITTGADGRDTRPPAPARWRAPRWIRLIEAAASVAAIVSGVVLVVMLVNVVLDVSGRNLLNHSLPGTLDATTYLWMPVISTLGLGLTQLRGEQIRVSLLVDAATPVTRRWVTVIGDAVMGVLVVWMTYLAFEQMLKALSTMESSLLGVPIWPTRIVVFLAYVIFSLSIVARIARDIMAREEALSEFDSIMKAELDDE